MFSPAYAGAFGASAGGASAGLASAGLASAGLGSTGLSSASSWLPPAMGVPSPSTPAAASAGAGTYASWMPRPNPPARSSSTPATSSRVSSARAAVDPRIGSLYYSDRQQLFAAPSKASPLQAKCSPADIAGGNKSLEYALQVILNVQSLDKDVLARAMLSPHDGIGGLDAASLMQRLQEVGPRLVVLEERLHERVQQLSQDDAVNLLKDLGLDDQAVKETLAGVPSLSELNEDIFTVLREALPVNTIADVLSVTVERRLREFLERRGVTRYSKDIVSLRHEDENWEEVWKRIYLQYPLRPAPGPLAKECEHRSSTRVIVIGPGFGLLATPHMVDKVRCAGYQLLELPELPNLENVHSAHQIQTAVQSLRDKIAQFKPHVVCAASKGGLYFPYLWSDPQWSISCVLINAHPNIKQLPEKAAVVVTQGSRDETFQRIIERKTLLLDSERVRDGLASHTRFTPLRRAGDSPALVVQQNIQVPCLLADGRVQMHVVPSGAVLKRDVTILESLYDASHSGYACVATGEDLQHLKVPAIVSYRYGREELEELARTASPGKSLLYLSVSGISVRPGKAASYTRYGDAHAAPESLCKEDCIARLIDAAASGKPEDALHESWANLVPEERRAGEGFLGYDPQSFGRFWNGHEKAGELGSRCIVDPASDEFYAVQQIFRSNPEEKVYEYGHDWTGKRIRRLERVQAPGQLQATSAYYEIVMNGLEQQGTRFVNGVHTRWLFHGSNAIDSIVADPVNGFKVTLANVTMWGRGMYFARDAQYPDDHGFFGEPRSDGTKDMLLCLVVTGVSVLGDESYAMKPYRHGTRHRYNSFVDGLSNPEIFVVNTSSAVLPAYIISYS